MSQPNMSETETNVGLGRAIPSLLVCSILGVALAFIWRGYGNWILLEINSQGVLNAQAPASDRKLDNLAHEVDLLKKSIEQISVAQNVTLRRMAELETRQLPAVFFETAFYYNPAFYYLGAVPAGALNVVPQPSAIGTARTAQPQRSPR